MDWVHAIASLLDPAEWQAVAALGTLFVATAAAVVALVQVRQVARLRAEQARPYVVAYVDRATTHSVDFVIKNFGETPARDIEIEWSRPPTFSRGRALEAYETFDKIPLLVPLQEWRSMWDFNGRRIEGGEAPYSVTVRCRDSRGRRLRDETFAIETRHFAHEMKLQRKTVDDVVTSLEKMTGVLELVAERAATVALPARRRTTKVSHSAAERGRSLGS